MANPLTVSVNEYVLIAIALAVFGIIGFRRGVNRELITFAGVLLALAVSSLFAGSMLLVVNRMYRIAHFVFAGGINAENPTVGWNEAKQLPDLVSSPMSKAILELVVFAIPVLLSYLIGGRVKAVTNAGQRLLGMLMGAVNGFLIAQHFVPLLFPAGETRLELATGPATDLLQNTQVVAVLVVVIVVILVAFVGYIVHGTSSKSKQRWAEVFVAPIEVLFGVMVLLFTLIGFARGFLKELGVTAIIIWMLFVLSLLGPLVERALGAAVESSSTILAMCIVYLLIISIAAIFSYQGETLAYGGTPPRGVTGLILGLTMGLVNGYLIAGTLWHYMARFGYPITWLGFTVEGLSPVAKALIPYLPPALLGQPVLLGQSLLLYLSILLILARVIR